MQYDAQNNFVYFVCFAIYALAAFACGLGIVAFMAVNAGGN